MQHGCSLEVCVNDPDRTAFVRRHLPAGDFRRVMLKPNWVKHQEHPEFPIEALVTSSAWIDEVIQACLEKYTGLERITVGDVPLQSCEWDLLLRQAGIDRLVAKYEGHTQPVIQFLDLRRERWRERAGFLHRDPDAEGDPAGYVEVVLDHDSFLDPISHGSTLFRVSDYDPGFTTSVHRPGKHRYLVARSVLESDLFINLPKMKTHQKAGLTGALKNLVGINGSKAHLVHHRKGFPSRGGDEFPESASRLIYHQTHLREQLQKRSPLLFSLARKVWTALKRLRGIRTVGTRENLDGQFYIGPGSWYGNDSIWRMIYDLNRIILFAHSEGGELRDTPQRAYVALLDGLVSGEGNGPLQPLPLHTGVIAASANPFLIDLAMSKLMGFDHRKIPCLAQRTHFPHAPWRELEVDHFSVLYNGRRSDGGLEAIAVLRSYLPPPGWKGHIELEPPC